MDSPVAFFFLAIANVVVFEVLFGLFYRILPVGKGEWCGFYWIGTLILCWSTHTVDPTSPQKLAMWSPVALVAVIHLATSFSTQAMQFVSKHQSSEKRNTNPSSFVNRVNATKSASKEAE